MNFSKKVITFMLIFLAAFVAVCLFIAVNTTYEPSTLIACVFGFCGIEGGLLASIKIFEKDGRGGVSPPEKEKNNDE